MLAVFAGAALWVASRTAPPRASGEIAPGALLAATFRDSQGQPRALGQFQGKIVVVNFWATWCAPCREEMPGFARLQARWADKNIQFVGLANDEPRRVERFGKALAIGYPLWTGGEEVGELSRRFGNRLGVLPHTVILDTQGRVLTSRVGPYSEQELAEKLAAFSAIHH